MLDVTRKILSLFDWRQKFRLALICALVLVSGLFESAGIAAILPFLQLLADPSLVSTNTYLATAREALGFETVDGFVLAAGIATLVFVVAGLMIKTVTLYAVTRFAMMRSYDIGSTLFDRSLAQPYSAFLGRNSAELATVVLNEVDRMVSSVLLPAMQLLPNASTVVLLTALLAVLEPTVTFAAVVALLGSYAIIYLGLRPVLERIGQRRVEANRRRFRIVQETGGGIKDIKLMGLEPAVRRRFRAAAFTMARMQAFGLVLSQLPRYLLEAIAFSGMMILVLLLTADGGTDIGALVPTLGFVGLAAMRLLPAMQQSYALLSSIRFNRPSLDAVISQIEGFETDDARSGPDAETGALPLGRSLALRGVVYRYPAAERRALDGLDLEIPAHGTTGIVGGSGAGKTTLVDVILGLLVPQEGRILVDDVALGPENRRAWQRRLGYVPQHIFLADDTVTANIAFGLAPDQVDHAAVERAARTACLHEFVVRELPDGYATSVGERGVRLSGGQRQRIGIARALYRDPDVLILDEATSALDNLTEKAVMEAVRGIGRQKAVVMIAHRLGTVRDCDRIVLLERGRVAAIGDFGTLLAESEAFRRLAEAG